MPISRLRDSAIIILIRAALAASDFGTWVGISVPGTQPSPPKKTKLYDRLVESFLVQLVLEELLSMFLSRLVVQFLQMWVFLSRLVVQFLQMWVFLVPPSVVVLGLMQYEVLACNTVLRGLSVMRGAS